jgi:hypothetical protein
VNPVKKSTTLGSVNRGGLFVTRDHLRSNAVLLGRHQHTATPTAARARTAVTALLAALLCGCTTDISRAVRQHDNGNHSLAADEMNRIAPTVSEGAKQVPDVQYAKDRLWVTIEKATILFQAGAFSEAMTLLYHAWDDARDDQYMESWYAENPFDPSTWDSSKLMQDVGQAVLGADQTEYVLQPYEMILCCTYSALSCMLSDEPGFMQYARRAQRLQVWEGDDLARAGYAPPTPPRTVMNTAVSSSLPQGQRSSFDTNMVFSLGDFQGTEARLNAAIGNATAVGAADPRVAFASVVAWASFVKGGEWYEAAGATRQLSQMANTPRLVKLMNHVGRVDSTRDFVLVVVDAGRAPERGYFNVAFPIIVPGLGSAYFRAVYPTLNFRLADRPSRIVVESDQRSDPLEVVTSIDAVVARNFMRREPELWWIPTLRAALRTTAAIVAQAADRDREGWGAGVLAATVIMAVAEQPDLRVWSTLPATQFAMLVPRPNSGMISLVISSDASAARHDVTVPAGSSLVYVRALTPAKAHAHVGTLRKGQRGLLTSN